MRSLYAWVTTAQVRPMKLSKLATSVAVMSTRFRSRWQRESSWRALCVQYTRRLATSDRQRRLRRLTHTCRSAKKPEPPTPASFDVFAGKYGWALSRRQTTKLLSRRPLRNSKPTYGARPSMTPPQSNWQKMTSRSQSVAPATVPPNAPKSGYQNLSLMPTVPE
jgi:hypothetical protein